MPPYWISHFQLSLTTFIVVLLDRYIDLEDIDLAFQISLLGCLHAEIYVCYLEFPVMSYSIPNVSLG